MMGVAAPADAAAPRPVVVEVTGNTGVSGGPAFPVHVAFHDPGCKVVGGTWTDQFGLAHDFGLSPDATCKAGEGVLTAGYASCTSPTGEPGLPGAYPQSLVLRDAHGRTSDAFGFDVVCLSP
jgi:hypothetical protein